MFLTWRHGRRLIRTAASAVASLTLAAGAVLVMSPAAQAAVDDPAGAADKIRPDLQEAFDANGKASFWIRFADRADLPTASQIGDWAERGEAVADALRTTARTSQTAVIEQLAAADVDYQAFWATNAIYVRDGPADLAAQVAARPEVAGLYAPVGYELIEPTPGQAQHTINAIEWGIANINADDVWDQFGIRGAGITVASIDTGTQYDHPALVGKYRGNNGDGTFDHNYNWFDAAGSCGDTPCDTNGHGTHTMGTMVGDDGGTNQIGVAPEANWITANGCCPSDAALIASGQWMLEPTDLNGENPDASKRPHIVNNSWGTISPSNDPFMEDILIAWAASGIFGVWANGNIGPGCATSGSPGSRIINYSVGAYDINNNIAGFSSRGPGQDGETKPNISAPGVNVRSSLPGNSYGAFNGTSMATPHVAGAIALVWSAAPALIGDLEGTRALLDDTATDSEDLQCGGTADDNNVYGEGRLDALTLLQNAPIGDTGTLAGTVTDADTGQPIAGATVIITGGISRTITTKADGTYSALLPVGDYTVTASAFGYADQTATASVVKDQTTTLNLAMAPSPSVTVSGSVTDGSGHGWPIYAKVTVAGTPVSTYTNPVTGGYSMQLPANATYTVSVQAQYPGYESNTEMLSVGDSNLTHDVQLTIDVEACNAPGYAFGTTGLTVENFNGGTLPAGWSIVDNIGNGQVWRFDDPGNRSNFTGGDGGFATVDSLFYGAGGSQNTELISPAIDLSGASDPVIRFNQDFNWYPFLGDEVADIDLSLDGGTTWQTVMHQEDADRRGPRLESIEIPQAAGQADVRIRFHYFQATFDDWWQIDNVAVGTCDVVDGGLVLGHVRDLNTGSGVNGAVVTNAGDPDVTTKSFATPDDPGLGDGFYWLFSAQTGSQDFTASAGSYTSQTESINVAPDTANELNFSLPAGMLTVTPGSIDATIELGGSASRTFTITNEGTAAAEVELSERSGSFEILRADGARLTQAQITSSAGAPVNRINGWFTPAATLPIERETGEPAVAEPGPAAPPWTNLPSYPRTIMDNSMAVVDGKVYSFGGGTGSGALADAFVFDPAAAAWSEIADLPEPRQKAAVAEIGGLIYVAGGWGPTGNPSTGPTLVYDPTSDSWSEAAPMPASRAAPGTAVLDGQLYAVGGCTSGSCATSTSVQRYDPASDSWEALANYPEMTAWLACAGIDGQVICTGGTDGSGTSTSTYAYNPGGDTWTQVADLPYDNWAMGYAAANGLFLVSGGVTNGFATVTNEGWVYDPSTDTWSDLPASNNTLYRSGSACGFYKVGGSSGGFSPQTFAEVLPGFEDCASVSDVPWLSVDPATTTLQPGDSVVITVSLDANVSQPGAYTASVSVKEDTPYRLDPVGVTLTVTPPATWGKVMGTVTGTACDGTQSPLDGATVQIDGRVSDVTLITEADGTYAYWLPSINSPLNIIVAKDGYQPANRHVRLTPGKTVVANFTLVRAC